VVASLSVRLVVVVGCVLLAVFACLAAVVTTGHALPWDHSIIDGLAWIPWERADVLASLSGLFAASVAAVVVVVLLWRRRFAAALLWCVTVGGVLLLDPALKALFERPALNPNSSGYSFPSGTAMISVAVLIGLLATVPAGRRRLVALLGALFLVAQGVVLVASAWHYPSDVLAGWCAATVWAALVWLVAFAGPRGTAVARSSEG
jgi:membrane-associated phospholipid phosphatase